MAASKAAALPLGDRPAGNSQKTIQYMVRKERLELSHLAAPEPKSGASTNSATSASKIYINGGYDGIRTCDPIIMSDVL